ncbi:MAG TPA: FecR domain-containing protein [Cyclobacteriaceae bacterium]|nr:FecR domain-containing protein [Cyclobacteriaceae bacterium]
MNKEENHIDDLITRCLTGEATTDEQEQLSAWIDLREENRKYYQKIKQAFDLSDQYYANKETKVPDLNIDHEWNHFLNQLEKKETTNIRSIAPEKNSYPMWARMAAAVLVVVASGFVINYFLSSNDSIHFETAGNTLEVTLPDGSHVALNHNSQLSFTPEYGTQTRTVKLIGEGFFEVEQNPQKPFIIEVDGATIEVLGTSFNVQGYNTRKELEVVVETGTVKFSVADVQKDVTLTAGDRGVYQKEMKDLSSKANNNVNFLSWKTRKLVFEENDLRSVVETLNQVYQANISIATQVPDTCVVTVTFDQQSLEAILNVLKTTLNLTYTIKDGQIEITHAGC